MSEPMSSPEVEDVVSSIRRLVSPEHRPMSRLLPDKLILTSSLRVVSDVVPLAEVPKPVAEVVAAEPVVDEMAAVETAAEAAPEAAVETLAEAPIVAAEVAPVAVLAITPEAEAVEETAEAMPATDVLHLVEAEWEDEIWPEPEHALAEITEQIEDAELITAPVAEAATGAWPEETALPDDGWQQAETEWVEEAPIPFAAHLRAVVAPEAAPEAAAEAAPLAMLETEVEPVAAPEAVSAEAVPQKARAIEDAVLQSLVREMIRDELHGELGERITRNVRKLVRAEINRALAARSFD